MKKPADSNEIKRSWILPCLSTYRKMKAVFTPLILPAISFKIIE